MENQNENWVTIFKAGDYEQGTFTEADVKQIAGNYNAHFHEAPLVIGHPASNDPAYGWVEKLRAAGDTLQAKFKNVSADFKKLWDERRFNKVSASFYTDFQGMGFYLRHVGALGAMPPAVKGLPTASFSETHSGPKVDIETDVSYGSGAAAFGEGGGGDRSTDEIIFSVKGRVDSLFPEVKNVSGTAAFSEAKNNNEMRDESMKKNGFSFGEVMSAEEGEDIFIQAAIKSQKEQIRAKGLFVLLREQLGSAFNHTEESFLKCPEIWPQYFKMMEELSKPPVTAADIVREAAKIFSKNPVEFAERGMGLKEIIFTKLSSAGLLSPEQWRATKMQDEEDVKSMDKAVSFYEENKSNFTRRGVSKQAYIESSFPGGIISFSELPKHEQTPRRLYDKYESIFRRTGLQPEDFMC